MRYTYELRDSRSMVMGILGEMLEAMSSHVFVDQQGKPFDGQIEIVFVMGESKILDLMESSDEDILEFKTRLLKNKGIPLDSIISVYHKDAKIDNDVGFFPIIQIGRKKKIFSIDGPRILQ